jgi:hypothetical protein
MRKSITSAAIAATAAAVLCGTGIATAATHSAATGTESFQMMTTSATSPTASVIASGVFTAPGTINTNTKGNKGTFVFPSGTVSLKHSAGTGKQSFNPKTCLLTVNEHGTFKLTGGTGAYAGITGHGDYQLSILAIAARSGSKCSESKAPLAYHQVIEATGPVTLP